MSEPTVARRPAALNATTHLMSVCNLSGFAIIDFNSSQWLLETVGVTAIMGISAVVLYYYWNGRNWARILVLSASVLALLNLLLWSEYDWLNKAFLCLEALLALFLLYWLNTLPVRAYFQNSHMPITSTGPQGFHPSDSIDL